MAWWKRRVRWSKVKDFSTKFPTSIDNRIFFQDVCIDKLNIMERYQKFIAAGAYTNASNYINGSNVSFYGAYILNLLEERLIAIENYAVYEMEKPDIVAYTDTEPTDKDVGYCWT